MVPGNFVAEDCTLKGQIRWRFYYPSIHAAKVEAGIVLISCDLIGR